MKSARLSILFFLLSLQYINAQIDKAYTQKVLDDYTKQVQNTGILFLKNKLGDEFIYTSGYADRELKKKPDPNGLFEIGSTSKLFTAISILQLIEQNKLSLNTTMDKLFFNNNYKYLANFKSKNYWDKITVGMLLNHTSGIIDYLNVYEDDVKTMKTLAIKGKVYSPEELVQLAINHGDANFLPGEDFKYSNTGYILLGQIISMKTGMNWRDYIQKNILDIVGMNNTYFGSRLPKEVKKNVIKGYYNLKASFMLPTLAGAAGEIISTLEDLKQFITDWQHGKLYKNKETLQMQRTQGYHQLFKETDLVEYGYGLMRVKGFYGHSGQTFGFQSFVAYNPESKSAYVIGANDATLPAMVLFFYAEKIQMN